MSTDDPSVPYGFCHCGCGRKSRIATRNHTALGFVRGEPIRFVNGHNSRTRSVPACGYFVEDRGYKTPCWIWGLTTKRDGYGMVRRDDTMVGAHVAIWEEANGPVPSGLELDHLCRVANCVNPNHLEAVTKSENVRRRPATKLTMDIARAVRASGASSASLARHYGVTASTIKDLRKGKTWREKDA